MSIAFPLKKRKRNINEISDTANAVINLFFLLYSAACLLPLLVVLSVSLSDQKMVTLYGYRLIPQQFTLTAYQYLLYDSAQIVKAYGISILVTAVGTVISVLVTALIAYPLSRQDFKFRNIFAFYVFFTMIFNGGLVPWYLVWTDLFSIRDTLFALIVPNHLMSAFFVMIMRTFFKNSIHSSIIESASIDGAGEWRILFRIVMPLSLPVLATIGLFNTLNYWNDWFNSLVFIRNKELFSLQFLMYKVLMSIQFLANNPEVSRVAGNQLSMLPTETARMAMAIIGIGPIVLAYPFFQRYFVKGLTVGAIKG